MILLKLEITLKFQESYYTHLRRAEKDRKPEERFSKYYFLLLCEKCTTVLLINKLFKTKCTISARFTLS